MLPDLHRDTSPTDQITSYEQFLPCRAFDILFSFFACARVVALADTVCGAPGLVKMCSCSHSAALSIFVFFEMLMALWAQEPRVFYVYVSI